MAGQIAALRPSTSLRLVHEQVVLSPGQDCGTWGEPRLLIPIVSGDREDSEG